jgi:ABC-type multidrug transport system permease subunit
MHAVSFVCESSSHKKNSTDGSFALIQQTAQYLPHNLLCASQFIMCLVTFRELFTTVKTFYMCMYTYQSKLGSGIFEIECHKLKNLGI